MLLVHGLTGRSDSQSSALLRYSFKIGGTVIVRPRASLARTEMWNQVLWAMKNGRKGHDL